MDKPLIKLWGLRAMYLGLVAVVLFIQTLPLETGPRKLAGPDIILAVTFVWMLRRPDVVRPFLLVVALLFSDFILQRPPGLWTLIVLIGGLVLRSRALELRESMYFLEWLTFAVVVVLCVICYQIGLIVTFVPTQNGLLTAMQTAFTIAIFPVVTFLSAWIFGVAPLPRAELEAKVGL